MGGKRLALSLLAVLAVTLLVSGTTLALFTSTGSNVDNSFAAGTVDLNAGTMTIADINNLAPGDTNGPGGENWVVTYTGTLDAWVGLSAGLADDPSRADPDGNGDSLVDCDGEKFSVSISSGGSTWTLNQAQPSISNAVVDLAAGGAAPSYTFNVVYEFDPAAGNACQDDDARLQLQVRAVQSANNSATGSPFVAAATPGWQSTGLVLAGGSVKITASGTANCAAGYGHCVTGPDGMTGTPCPSTCPAPGLPLGALVARVGSGPPVYVGYEGYLAGTGELFLAYNDGLYSDNLGGYSATVGGPITW